MLRLAILYAFVPAVAAQAVWNATATLGPPPRRDTVMVSDGQGAIVIGGRGLSGAIYNDVWRFSLGTWTLQVPGAGPQPPVRARFAAAFDPVRQRVVIFGGDPQQGTVGALGDTWEWSVQQPGWTQLAPAAQPSPRMWACMAYDPAMGRVLMFGGSPSGSVSLNDTWSWDGTNWQQMTPATVPSPRQQAMMATNWSTGEVVMYGGSTSSGPSILGETWLWSAGAWSLWTTSTVPGGGLRGGQMDYDRLRDRMVLVGGRGYRGINGWNPNVWEFDGNDWLERVPVGTAPYGRTGAGFCYVAGLGRSYLFGGYNGSIFGDTWDYQTNAPAITTNFGAACPSSVGMPTLDVQPLPWLGETVSWSVGNLPPAGLPLLLLGLSNTSWAGGPLPVSLASLGAPGCAMLVSPDTVTDASIAVPLPVPTTASLIGQELHSQAAVLEFTGSSLDIAMSVATSLTIGAR